MAVRILVVEDDEALRCTTAELLTGAGYDVAQARDYQDALSILEDGSEVVLLLTDVVLPVINGFVLGRLALKRHRHIKIIYMTAYETAAMREASGPLLRKPVKAHALLATIGETLKAA